MVWLKKTTKLGLQRLFQSYGNQAIESLLYFHPSFTCDEKRRAIENSFHVHENFISESEESSLLSEIEPKLKRMRYEADHWDAAILGYRETEKKDWNDENTRVLQKIRSVAFRNGSSMPLVHVLDLKEDGVIKPHVDSVKFCGNTIAGLSLLTDSVMRLVKEDDSNLIIDIFLPRRSLYIMSGPSRYLYTHAILGNEESYYRNIPVRKGRRVSVICRNDPSESSSTNSS